MPRTVAFSLLLVACLSAASNAMGQPGTEQTRRMRLQATYDVAAGCMSAGTFLRKLSEHFDMGGANGLDLLVVVHRNPETAVYAVTMSFNGSTPVRLEHAHCDKLLEDAIIEAGIARTELPIAQAVEHIDRLQVALARDAERHGSEPYSVPDTGVEDAWSHVEPLATPRSTLVNTPDNTPLKAAPNVPVDSKPPAPLDPFERQGLVVGPHLRTGLGILPEPGKGLGLTALLTAWSVQWRVDATWWLPQSWMVPPGELTPFSRLSASQLAVQTLAVGACWRVVALGSSVQLRACLQGVGNRITADSSSTFGAGSNFNVGLRSHLGLGWAFDRYQVELLGTLDGLTRGATIELEQTPTGDVPSQFGMGANVVTFGLTFGGAIPLAFLEPENGR